MSSYAKICKDLRNAALPFLTIFLFIFILSLSANAGTVTNATTGTSYSTIETALGEASEGDTLYCEGLFNEYDIDWPNTNYLTLVVSPTASAPVTIDAQSQSRIFNVANTLSLTIEGISLQNGLLTGGNNAAAIYLASSGSNLYLVNAQIRSNTAEASGGAIYAIDSYVTAIDSVFYGNHTTAVGGVGYGGDWYIRGCSFIDNTCPNPSGVFYFNSGDVVTIEESVFDSNRSTSGIAGVIYGASLCNISSSEFRNNSAASGGGVFQSVSPIYCFNSTFESNSGGSNYGGVAFSGTTLVATNCSFSNNDAGYGGVAYGINDLMVFDNCRFSGNSAITDGGVIKNGSTLILKDSTFTSNEAGGKGGVFESAGTATISNCAFTLNKANEGGIEYTTTVSIADSSFISNEAGNGGVGLNWDHTVNVYRSIFKENKATAGNGGVFRGTIANYYDCTIEGNSASGDGGVGYGGVGETTATRCAFSNNSAGQNGGVMSSASLRVTDCDIYGNSATTGGGVVYSGTLTVINSKIHGNHAYNYGVSGSNLVATNSIIYNNYATHNSGVTDGSLTTYNSTIFGNTAESGGVMNSGGGFSIQNSIMFGNNASSYPSINLPSVGDKVAYFSVLQPDAWFSEGMYANHMGSVSSEVLFVSTNESDPEFLRLDAGSPAVDLAHWTNTQEVDLAGNVRPHGLWYDSGAYEFPGPSVSVESPNGGETLISGETFNITWITSPDVIEEVIIRFTTNEGATWTTLTTETWAHSDISTYEWTVPKITATQCQISIEVVDGAGIWHYDNNNLRFTILEYLPEVYISPTGDDTFGSGTPSDPFRTLQQGLDVVSSGGKIYAMQGTFTLEAAEYNAGNMAVWPNKDNITLLISPDATEPATFDAQGLGRIIQVNDPLSISIESITLKRVNAGDGSVIYLTAGSILHLASCEVRDSIPGTSLLIYCKDSTVEVFDSLFIDNTSTIFGWGSILATGCIFKDNSGSGGIVHYGGGEPNGTYCMFTSCTFEGNSASNSGGIVSDNYVGFNAYNCIFKGNSAGVGGGVFRYTTGVVTNCVFADNYAGQQGGVINDGGPVIADNCVFIQNSCDAIGMAVEHGGGVLDYGTGIFNNCIFYANYSPNGNVIGGYANPSYFNYSNVQDNGIPWYLATFDNCSFSEPRFISTIEGNPNYLVLDMGSPCIDTASIEAPAADLAGYAKPRGFGNDMGVFEFQGPSIRVTYPNGGEYLVPGEETTITWITSDEYGIAPNSVNIRVTSNEGLSWEDIATGTADDGSQAWTVPSVSPKTYMISIEVTNASSEPMSNYDTSDDYFNVMMPVVYISPTGSDEAGDGSVDDPFRTLQTGLNRVTPSGEVRAMPGIYSESGDYSVFWPNKTGISLVHTFDAVGVDAPTTFDAQNMGRFITTESSVDLTIEGIEFRNSNLNGNGGFMLYRGGNMVLRNVEFNSCKAFAARAGVIYAENNSTIEAYNCRFISCEGSDTGGCFLSAPDGYLDLTIDKCVFMWNTAFNGGVFSNSAGFNIYATNCIFYGNTAGYGAVDVGCTWTSTNCVFAYNTATLATGVFRGTVIQSSKNMICWGNQTGPGGDGTVFSGAVDVSHVTNSNIQSDGWEYFSLGTTNTSREPNFISIDPNDPEFLMLGPGSAAIDSGSSEATATDFAGNIRPHGFGNDMGVYEFQGPGIRVTYPNGGENFNLGQDVTITWITSDEYGIAPNSVNVRFSSNEGSSWEDIATGIDDTGSQLWTIPAGYTTPRYLISIEATNASSEPKSNYDTSDDYFYVLMPAVYISPTGSDEAGDGSIDNPYRTLQKGLNMVAPSGEVRAMQGTYTLEAGEFISGHMAIWPDKDNITLIASEGATEPITIDALGIGSIISIESAVALTIEGITLQNGHDYSLSGGGIFMAPGSSMRLIDDIFRYCTSEVQGGAIFAMDATVEAVNCLFEGNLGIWGGGGVAKLGTWRVSNCVFRDNAGGGSVAHSANFTANNSIFENNSNGVADHGIWNLVNCIVRNNHNVDHGGFGFWTTFTATNCVFTGNHSDQSGGVYAVCDAKFFNCTVYNNSAASVAGVGSGALLAVNTIFWGNSAPSNPLFSGGPYSISYSDLQESWSGTGNISSDPTFVSTDELSADFLRLDTDSLCINTASIEAPSDDLAGNVRPHGFGFDMGAYEYQGPSISVESPNGGESFTQGDPISISWIASDEYGFMPDQVNISYSNDGGATWTFIASPAMSSSPYIWSDPSLILGSAYLISIEATNTISLSNHDTSNNTFSIGIPIVYISPTGSDEAGDGSPLNPFRTLQKGLDTVTASGEVRAMPGIFTIEASAYTKTLEGFTCNTMAMWLNKTDITLMGTFDALGNSSPITFDAESNGRFISLPVGNGVRMNIKNVTMINGHAIDDGGNGGIGGAFYLYPQNITLAMKDVICVNNNADIVGGAVASVFTGNNIFAENSQFIENTAFYGGGVALQGTWTVTNCAFVGNGATNGNGGVGFSSGIWGAYNCLFKDNFASTRGGVFNSVLVSATGCTFEGNWAPSGAIFTDNTGYNVLNCIFKDNRATTGSGAIAIYGGSLTATNCVFNNNSAVQNCISNNFNEINLHNCTVYGNTAETYGISNYGTYNLINTIVWGNSATSSNNSFGPSATVNSTYSDIQTDGWVDGTGNISAEPLFIDPFNDNFLMLMTSECIDSGTFEGAPAFDITGSVSRPQPSADPYANFDMGVYEQVRASFAFSITPVSGELFTCASDSTVETTYYHINISNESNTADSYVLSANDSASGSGWTSAFYPEWDDRGVPTTDAVTQINNIAAGASVEVFVGVTPPLSAALGSTNITEVGIISLNDATKTAASTFETMVGNWMSFRQHNNSTRRSVYSGPAYGLKKWSFTTGGWIENGPVIGNDGTAYIGSRDNKLYAIYPDGSLKWSYSTGGAIESSPAIGPDGTIYIGSQDNKIHAVNPDGSFKWSYSGGGNKYSPTIGSDGTIYSGSFDRILYAINPDGSLKWTYTTGDRIIMASPAIGFDGTIYIGSWDRNLYAINPDGSLKWTYYTGGWVDSSPAIDRDGTVYIGSKNANLYAINPDGTFKWSYPTGGEIHSSPAIGPDGTIYVGSNDQYLYAINPDGTFKWSYLTGSSLYFSSPAVGADGTVYVGSADSKLYAINPDGTLKWSYLTGGDTSYSSPTIGSDGIIYIGSTDGKLYAISGLVIINPNGGEIATSETTYPITFGISDEVDELVIRLSTNGGSSWDTLITDEAWTRTYTGTGTYEWIPTIDLITTEAMISIDAHSTGGNWYNDTSNATFEIVVLPDLAVVYISPSGSDEYPAGDGSVDKPYRTLQKGLNRVAPTGEVRAMPGTYTLEASEYILDSGGHTMALWPNKTDISFVHTFDAYGVDAPSTVDAQSMGRVFKMPGSGSINLTIEGISFINGFANPDPGGFIYAGTANVNNIFLIDVNVINCTAENQAGAILIGNTSIHIFADNCVFKDCVGKYPGGVAAGGSWDVRNSQFLDNSSMQGGALYGGAWTVDNCIFRGNSATMFGGAMMGGQAWISNSTFEGNSAAMQGGVIHSIAGTVSNCVFNGNSAASGGVFYNLSGPFDIQRSLFINNQATMGGINYAGGTTNYYNCIFLNNHATQRLFTNAVFGLYNCSLYGNTAETQAIANDCTFNATNTIIFGNVANDNTMFGAMITNNSSYCDLQPEAFIAGTGNISIEPNFINAPSGDLHLDAGSPAIDRGNDISNYIDYDLNVRPKGFGFDMGAYEFQGPSVRIIQPNGGETVTAGLSYNIIYETSPEVEIQYIRLSTNEGASWTVLYSPIAEVVSGVVTFEWSVGHFMSTQCLVSIEVKSPGDSKENVIYSQNVFTVTEEALSPVVYIWPHGDDVSGDGTIGNPFRTAQRGLNKVAPNGKIYAMSGVYTLEASDFVSGSMINWLNKDAVSLMISPDATEPATFDAQGYGGIITVPYSLSITIEGITFKNAAGDHAGGAIALNNSIGLNIKNVIIKDCANTGAPVVAGAIYAGGNSTVEADHCQFINNSSGDTSGAFYGGTWYVSSSEFIDNHTSAPGGMTSGGTWYVVDSNFTRNWGQSGVFDGSTVVATMCSFSDNRAYIAGGVFNGGSAILDTCTLSGNTAESNGGVAYDTTVTVINSLITSNESNLGGVAVNGSWTAYNSIFNSNNAVRAASKGGVFRMVTVNADHCTFEGNSAQQGGVAHGALLTLKDCWATDNRATTLTPGEGGGFAFNLNMYLENCIFLRNSSSQDAGVLEGGTTTVATNCAFIMNSAAGKGGVEYQGGTWNVYNCIFAGNHAREGGVASFGLFSNVMNCTLYGNTAETGGVINSCTWNNITNSIFYDNSATTSGPVYYSASFNPSYSDIQPDSYVLNDGNVSSEPIFVSTDETSADFLKLDGGSPCIDTASIEAPAFDFAGNVRPHGLGFDMGAYEFQGPSVRVISPNGGESIQALTEYLISFEVNPSATLFVIALSTDEGISWNTITNESGSYSGVVNYFWNVPDLISTECLIMVYVESGSYNNYDVSDGKFEITAAAFMPIVYISPGGSDLSGDGSPFNPYLTLQKGLDRVAPAGQVRAMPGTHDQAGDRGVVWPAKDNITLIATFEWNGTVNPVTFDAMSLNRHIDASVNDVSIILSGITFKNGSTSGAGGVINMTGSTVEAYDCVFSGNSSSNAAGVFGGSGTVGVNGCRFMGNIGQGGGVFGGGLSGAAVNSIFAGNSGIYGGVANGGTWSMVNCVFYSNGSGAHTSIGYTVDWNSRNCIYKDNDTTYYPGFYSSTVNITYSDIQPTIWVAGTGNISSEPMFVSTDPANADYLKILGGSPCIDTASIEAPSVDIAGNVRPHGFGYDMGVYEFQGSSIRVIRPNGGETLEANSSYSITFEVLPLVSEVYIRLSTNEGASWDTIVDHFSGSFSGIVEHLWTVNALISTECLISIEAIDPVSGLWNMDTSDATFEIASLATPTTLEIERVGSNMKLKWSSVANVDVWVLNPSSGYYDYNSPSWSLMQSNVGPYEWTDTSAGSVSQRYYRVAANGTTNFSLDINGSMEAVGKLNVQVNDPSVDPNKFFVSNPFLVTDESLAAVIGDQAGSGDMLFYFDSTGVPIEGAYYDGGQWLDVTSFSPSSMLMNIGKGYGYQSVNNKQIVFCGKVKAQDNTSSIYGGGGENAIGYFIGSAFPKEYTMPESGLNSSSIGTNMLNSGSIYLFDVSGIPLNIALHTSNDPWYDIVYDAPSTMTLVPGKGYMFMEPVQSSFVWVQKRP